MPQKGSLLKFGHGSICCSDLSYFCSLDERIKVAAVHVHSKNYTYSDVALLKLEEKLDYSLGVMPICLPEVRKAQSFLMELSAFAL